MNRITRFTFVLMLAGFIAACGGEEEAPPEAQAPADTGDMVAPDGMRDDMRDDMRPADIAPSDRRDDRAPAAEAPPPRPLPSLRAAQSYDIVERRAGDNDAVTVWIFAEGANNKSRRAQTALRAALDVIERGDASSAEVVLLPVLKQRLARDDISLARASFDPATSAWSVQAASGELDDFAVLILELMGDYAQRFEDSSGTLREDALYTYLARVLASSPREVRDHIRDARRLSQSKTTYP